MKVTETFSIHLRRDGLTNMILDPPIMVRLMVIETVENCGIIETATLTVPLTEKKPPLTLKEIQVKIGMQIMDVVNEPV